MAALLKEITAGNETFMTLGNTLLVKSKSQADHWYRIEDAKCSCPGFTYRGACRHVVAALELEATTTDTVTVERTDRWGGCWIVLRDGKLVGMGHYSEIDAQRHADDVRSWSDAAWSEWLERFGYGAPVPPVPTARPSLYVVQKEAML